MTDITSISLSTTTEGRFYDILLNNATYDGKKVVVSVLTDAVTDDNSNVAIKLSSTVDGSYVQVELTDTNMDDLFVTDASASLQVIVRHGATKLGSKLVSLTKQKMIIPTITFGSDQGNNEAATVEFNVDYSEYTPYHTASILSSVIVEYHLEGDGDAEVIELSGNDLTGSSNDKITISIPNLVNNSVYEYIVTGKNSAGETNYVTNKVRPVETSEAPVIANVESIITDDVPDASNVQITITWSDADALAYLGEDESDDSANSTIKLRIGTATDINTSKDVFDASNVASFHEVILTNGQLRTAILAAGLTITLPIVNIIAMDASANTDGVELKAQMLPESMLDAENTGESGQISTAKLAYIESIPTLEDITVSLDPSTGTQTFTVNGTVPSKDSTGVTIIMRNSITNTNFVDLSNTDVITDGSLDIIEASGQQSYINLDADSLITATLSQVDRNATLDSNNDVVVYSVDKSFNAYQLKIPNAPTVEFLGNATDGGDLRTKLTDLTNNGDHFDVIGTDVRYELVDANGDALTSPVDVSYSAFNTIDHISYSYELAQDYYLKATKYASLSDIVAGVYSADISQNQEIEIDALLGPLKATTSASLVLSDIQVSVDANGEQTFFINGSIESLDASGATLTLTDGSTEFVNTSVVVDVAGQMTEISGSRTYLDLSSNPTITATLTQPDLNGNSFDMSANISFSANAFKTPETPDASDSLSKNIVGNDGKLRANYAVSDLKEMNGYDLVSVTAQINGLSDVSGVFDSAVDDDGVFHVKADANQTIDLSYGYDVDSSYSMIFKKKYALDTAVYQRYVLVQKDTSVTDLSGGVVDSATSNSVFYMGNPVISEIVVSGVNNTVTVAFDTHGADLTPDHAVTLVLVAKDGLAGYANGTNTGNIGSTVMTKNSNSIDITGYNSTTLGNQAVTATFRPESITDAASSVVIVDADNSHSAVSLSNFPTTDLADSYNSKTN